MEAGYCNIYQGGAGMNQGKIAVIGAGLSGATVAAALTNAGYSVRIFEKSRGMGGRMATRRSSGFEFDHGAQYFTVKSEVFGKAVKGWVNKGLAAPWEARFASLEAGNLRLKPQRMPRYVGIPRMNSIVREMLNGIEVELNTRVVRAFRSGKYWALESEDCAIDDSFDALIMAIPPAQARELLGPVANSFSGKLDTVMDACWAVLAAFDGPVDLAFDAAFVNGSSLSWIARNSSKPARRDRESWVLHGSREWSREKVEAEPEFVLQELLDEFFRQTGIKAAVPSWSSAHRWLYAQASEPLMDGCLWDPEIGLGLCGDWCRGSRVEGAFLSGKDLAGRITED